MGQFAHRAAQSLGASLRLTSDGQAAGAWRLKKRVLHFGDSFAPTGLAPTTAGNIRAWTTRKPSPFIGMWHSHPELDSMYRAHLDDNLGGMLPHLMMADIIRWMGVLVSQAEGQGNYRDPQITFARPV